MTSETHEKLGEYYASAGSWADERTRSIHASRKIAWIVAMAGTASTLLLAIAFIFAMPLKTVVSHTLLVDRQTGFVQALDPSQPQKIVPQKALTQAFLVQYVQAREGFDISTVQGQFRKVALWSSSGAKSKYINVMQATNPESPLAILPRNTVIDVQVRSVSQLSDNNALVRFASVRRDQGASEQPPENWVAVIKYRYSNAPMTVEDRYINPLGFEVIDYRRSAEALPVQAVMPVLQTATATASRPDTVIAIPNRRPGN